MLSRMCSVWSSLNRLYYYGVAVACFPVVQATDRFKLAASQCVRSPSPLCLYRAINKCSIINLVSPNDGGLGEKEEKTTLCLPPNPFGKETENVTHGKAGARL